MARPREFDEREVLDRALDVFWTKGFEATSVQDLVNATGLGRASLYAAFGDKEGLFAATLEHYQKQRAAELDTLVNAACLRPALKVYFDTWIDTHASGRGPRGCFVSKSATMCETQSGRLKGWLERAINQMDQTFVQAIERAQARGEISSHTDAKALAHFLSVFLQGLSAASSAGQDNQALKTSVELMLRALD